MIGRIKLRINIARDLRRGIDKQSIYDKYKPHYDIDILAKYINSHVSDRVDAKTKRLNRILIFLLLVSIVLKMSVTYSVLAMLEFSEMFLVFFVPAINVIFLIAVCNYWTKFYIYLGLWGIYSIYDGFTSSGGILPTNLIFTFFIVGFQIVLIWLSFKVYARVNSLTDIRFLPKNENGDYSFNINTSKNGH
jgi:hypothetical protein